MSCCCYGPANHKQWATIAAGTDPSGVIDLLHYRHVGFIFPDMTSTAVTITASDEKDGTFVAVLDADGNAVSLDVTSSPCAVGLHEDERDAVAPWRWIKLVPGTSEVAAREITIVMNGD